MSKPIIMMASLMLLSGCDKLFQPKEVTVCVDILKEAVIDPGALKINSKEISEGPATLDDLQALYEAQFKENMPLAAIELMRLYRKKGLPITRSFAALDATYDLRSGRHRDQVLCEYLKYDGNSQLVSFTINNQTLHQPDFFDFFFGKRRPDSLGTGYMLE